MLLTAAGENSDRLRNEAAFAALYGVSPVEASSGKVVRRRLNRVGNRQAHHVPWRIVMVRLTCDERTKTYAARRRADGKSDRHIVRCRKHYVAEAGRCRLVGVSAPPGSGRALRRPGVLESQGPP
jgi:transposase